MTRPHQKYRAFLLLFLITTVNAYAQQVQRGYAVQDNVKKILTPEPKPQPRINGPVVYGCRPDHPFLYRIPCQGERPIHFAVKNLPTSLKLDPSTGIITGKAPGTGTYDLLIQANNSKGKDKRKLKIIAGDKLALTPPMGWNSWYVHFDRVSDKNMREAAANMISSGMADVGYQYINSDDCWMNASGTNQYMQDSTRFGPVRNANGDILPNIHFPDMKSMTRYIHSLGLKAGIYSSPGAKTCTGMAGSLNHEEQDAAQFAAWGFDFLKYDWCSYGQISGPKPSIEQIQKPYIIMGKALRRQPRDIVFNLCEYGMGNVWEWGQQIGGNSWRTAGDLGFELDHFFSVALKNAEHAEWSRPGAWNDPDYIQIGWIGSQVGNKLGLPKPVSLTANEQYAYMSLWSLMAAPLFFSGDMAKLDKFTINVLCNPEVIAVDQDPLGKCGSVIKKADSCFLMIKHLADGSNAVGLFNREKKAHEASIDWSELKISGNQDVLDLWREKDMGVYKQKFSVQVPPGGVVMIKISKRYNPIGLK